MRSYIAAVAVCATLAAGSALAQPADASKSAPATPAANAKASVETTSIGDLVGNEKTKAVLQKDMPELLTYDGLDQIKGMTMRDISKYPQANLDDARLAKIQKDLDAITP